MWVSVLLRLFISSNEVCNTAYALYVYMSRTPFSNLPQFGPMILTEMKNNLHYNEVRGVIQGLHLPWLLNILTYILLFALPHAKSQLKRSLLFKETATVWMVWAWIPSTCRTTRLNELAVRLIVEKETVRFGFLLVVFWLWCRWF